MSQRGKYDRTLSGVSRRREQRRQLLVAATWVFSTVGYARANVEAVIQRAGMSRRTFYEHFVDLEDALARVHEASGRFAVRHVEEQLALHADPMRRLENGVRSLLELVSQNAGLARVLFWEIRAAGPRFETRQQKLRDQFAALLHGVLAEAHQSGLVRRAPDDISVLAVVAGIEAVGARMASGEPGLEEATVALVRLARGTCM